MLIALIVFASLIALVLVLAATKPSSFRVERSATISAPREQIFALLEDFHAWPSWSPWEALDPNMQRTYSGAERGAGAQYAWLGNKKVGQGTMAILGATPPTELTIKLDFLKPFEAHNTTVFTLSPEGNATRVTWAMHGPNLFMGKVMSVFISMDKMIGRDFEKGLANMKRVAER